MGSNTEGANVTKSAPSRAATVLGLKSSPFRYRYRYIQVQPQVSQIQAPPIVSSGPTFSENVKIDEKEPSDHADHSEGGDLASVEDPGENPGNPKLEKLMMTEEEERDFETFALGSPSVTKRQTLRKASQGNTKFYSQAQQVHRQEVSFTSQARPVESQAIALDQANQVQGQAQPLLNQAQTSAQDQPVSQTQFPVQLPQGQGRPLPVLVRHGLLSL